MSITEASVNMGSLGCQRKLNGLKKKNLTGM